MSGPQSLGRHLKGIAGKALGKHGMAFGALLTDWTSIVGPLLAEQTGPLKLIFPPGRRDQAVLHLRVSGSAALLIQHEEPQILERINGYFGYKAVTRLKLVQCGSLLKPGPRIPTLRKLPAGEEQQIIETAAAIESDELRAALERLGRGILGGR
jgi:hypothetical protein